jgi:hypothetical protein
MKVEIKFQYMKLNFMFTKNGVVWPKTQPMPGFTAAKPAETLDHFGNYLRFTEHIAGKKYIVI